MTVKVLLPESEQLTFICGLGWPEVTRYYVSNRSGRMWEFWEQPPESRYSRLIFGWVAHSSHREPEVARRLLEDYLGAFKTAALPTGEIVQGLLSLREIQTVLGRHAIRGESPALSFPSHDVTDRRPIV